MWSSKMSRNSQILIWRCSQTKEMNPFVFYCFDNLSIGHNFRMTCPILMGCSAKHSSLNGDWHTKLKTKNMICSSSDSFCLIVPQLCSLCVIKVQKVQYIFEDASAGRWQSPIEYILRKMAKQDFIYHLLVMACSDLKVTLTHALNIISLWNFYRLQNVVMRIL